MMTAIQTFVLSLCCTVSLWIGAFSVGNTADWKIAEGPLSTPWTKDVDPERVLPEYPRPQMVREEWINLNGLWDYAVTSKAEEKTPGDFQGKILVPFPVESALSGVMRPLKPEERLWYKRTFVVPDEWAGKRILLHFGAVDWESTVYLNGRKLGRHRGGFDSFTFDITETVRKEVGSQQELVVSVLDPTDAEWQLRGKQMLHPAGCSYTACSGIWQTVWLEPVSYNGVDSLKMVPDLSDNTLKLSVNARIRPEPVDVQVEIFDDSKLLGKTVGTLGNEITPSVARNLVDFYKARLIWTTTDLTLDVPEPKLWAPDSPFLYDMIITIKDKKDGKILDTVKSYFAMRSLSIGKNEAGMTRMLLNGKPIPLAGVLDHGYWPDGIYTAPTDDALKYDLEIIKRCGMNATRKHVKTESERWYYWCDKLGVLVFQDMPTGNEGNPHTDLPNSPEASMQCELEKRTLIRQLFNHPSIVCWIPFNEGWGQHDTLRYARWIKAEDPSRFVNEASGFPWHGTGDVLDCHGGIGAEGMNHPGKFCIVSECGGVGIGVPKNEWNPEKSWAYFIYNPETGGGTDGLIPGGKSKPLPPLDEESKFWATRQVQSIFKGLHDNFDKAGCNGFFYCQIVDVETECNGLVSYDRVIWKVDPDEVAKACRGELIELPPSARSKRMAEMTKEHLPVSRVKQTDWRFTTKNPDERFTTELSGKMWYEPDFDDSEWQTGKSGFGTPSGDDSRVGTEWTTSDIWIRKSFELTDIPKEPVFRIFHDEDFEIYVNGIPACQGTGFVVEYHDFKVPEKVLNSLKTGKNEIAVHCRQTTGGQFIDVGIYGK